MPIDPTTSDFIRAMPIPDIPRELWDAFAGSYQIVEHVGAGNTGRVYKAIAGHLSHGREVRFVAVKALGMLADPLAEAHSGSQIAHTNVASVIDCGKCSGIPYIVSEWVEPEEGYRAPRTFDLWAEGRSPREIVAMALPVLDALGLLHSQFIAHRDVKASNVLIDRHGNPRLVDFGMGGPSRSVSHDLRLFMRMLRKLIPEAPDTLGRILAADDRYTSAPALWEDLRRWQHDEPVMWTRPGVGKRLVLLLRRRPLSFPGVVAAVLFLIMSAALAVHVVYSNIQHEKQVAHERALREAAQRSYTNMAHSAVNFLRHLRDGSWDEEYLPIMAAFDALAGREAFRSAPEPEFVQGKGPNSALDLLSLWDQRKMTTRRLLEDSPDGVYELALQTALAHWEAADGNYAEAKRILRENLKSWRAALADPDDPLLHRIERFLDELDEKIANRGSLPPERESGGVSSGR